MKRSRAFTEYRDQLERHMSAKKYKESTTKIYSWHSATMLKSIELPPEQWTEKTIDAYLRKRMRERKDRSYKLQLFSTICVLIEALRVPVRLNYIARLQEKYLN
jgi:hypothetical protein